MINFAGTLAQLTFSIAIIGIISNQLQIVRATPLGPNSGKWSYACLLATSEHPQTCQYAYSVASVSIFAGFIVSMFQCLTLDCCGAVFFECGPFATPPLGQRMPSSFYKPHTPHTLTKRHGPAGRGHV
jgi:hypothetical protein